MTNTKTENLTKLIPSNLFETCKIDNKSRAFICKEYRKEEVTTHKTVFYLEKFQHHLKIKFNIDLKTYCKTYLQIKWPICPVAKTEVGFKISGKGLHLSTFIRGKINKDVCPAFKAACEKFSIERVGAGNPMFGETPWNKGLTIETSASLKKGGEARRGKCFLPQEEREKRRQRMKGTALHTTPHSAETKEKARINTARLWAEGVFNRVSSIHIKMRDFLKTLPLLEEFKEEFQVKYFSLDFAFPNAKIGIETDGDYYHVNPQFYPNGPKTAMQRRNFGRDKSKNAYLAKCGWTLLRFWECDINANIFQEKLICKLKELNLLKN